MPLTTEKVLNALGQVIDPDLKKDLVSLGMIKDLEVDGKKVRLTLELTTPACPLKESIKNACIKAIHDLADPDAQIDIILSSKTSTSGSKDRPMLKGVKNIIAVASGKGGVGKSTVSANLAVSLASSGARTALVDADLYGPSIPMMFQVEDAELSVVESNGKNMILPIEKYGVSLISIGFFVDPAKALIWRGPMATSAIKQLFSDTQWGELDYMIIDLPPGTGDIHLSLVQTIPLTGTVIVTTPQQMALADARKAVSMFTNDKIKVPVLGIVENMAWFTPAELPENKYYIFGKNGGADLAREQGITLLGQIPLIQGVREAGDKGKPAVLIEDHPAKPFFEQLTGNLVRQIAKANTKAGQSQHS